MWRLANSSSCCLWLADSTLPVLLSHICLTWLRFKMRINWKPKHQDKYYRNFTPSRSSTGQWWNPIDTKKDFSSLVRKLYFHFDHNISPAWTNTIMMK